MTNDLNHSLAVQAVCITMAANLILAVGDQYYAQNVFDMDDLPKVLEYNLSFPVRTLEIGLIEDGMYTAEHYLGLEERYTDTLPKDIWNEYSAYKGHIIENWSEFETKFTQEMRDKISRAVEQVKNLIPEDSFRPI